MIKLLALDLDGTLLNSKGKVPEENRNAIRAAEERGVLVTIATGRRFRDGRPLGIELELNAPLITHNGALSNSPTRSRRSRLPCLRPTPRRKLSELESRLAVMPS
jgi:HAD superfamily hydrolase (TIGR01484 family)